MIYFEDKNEKPDSMISLLVAQCDHLEELMTLMRKQIDALSRNDQTSASDIASEQNEITRKLEISQRQIDRKMV